MKKKSKRYIEIKEKVDQGSLYDLNEGCSLIKDCANSKFDESIDISIGLKLDPRHADQNVRGALVLPNGTGKKRRVLVFAEGDAAKKAIDAGADHVGVEDYIDKIQSGWMEFDVVVATPNLMSSIGKLGRTLGVKGMMPSPKSGTVTNDVDVVVNEIKKGRIEYKVNKNGIMQFGVGKASFETEHLNENIRYAVDVISKTKPSSVKGSYLKYVSISSTMGVGLKLKIEDLLNRGGN